MEKLGLGWIVFKLLSAKYLLESLIADDESRCLRPNAVIHSFRLIYTYFKLEFSTKQKIVDKYNHMFKHMVMYTRYIERLPSEWLDVSDMFVALGDEQRQRILMTFEPNERLNVTQIASASKLSRTAVSHHLKLLKQADVLRSEKIGKEVYFWINKQKITDCLQRVINFVEQNT